MNYKNQISDRVKILLIDEDESIFYLIRRVLQRENYRLYTSTSGRSGMEMSTSICPDLILMDTQLSDMDGIGLIQWFREWTDCPILVVSGQTGYMDKVNALYAGADDYIVKPFHEQELAARIYTALRRRGGDSFFASGIPDSGVSCPQFGNCGDVSDVVREDMGTVCKQRQPYSAGQYDKYPQEDREDPDGSDVHYHDPACGLPHA